MAVFFVVLKPLFSGKTFVGFEAHLCELFGFLQKFFCAVGEELVKGREPHFAFQEVLEFGPVGFFAVEAERILVCAFEDRVVTV